MMGFPKLRRTLSHDCPQKKDHPALEGSHSAKSSPAALRKCMKLMKKAVSRNSSCSDDTSTKDAENEFEYFSSTRTTNFVLTQKLADAS